MTPRQSGEVCVLATSSLFLRSATPNMAAGWADGWVAERTFAWLNQFRRPRFRYEKRGGHSRGILVLGVRSDLLALSASRFGGEVKVSFACNALTRRSLAPSMVASGQTFPSDRPNHLALPRRREA